VSVSPFTRRLLAKIDAVPALCRRLTLKDAKAIERAFVEALKEEVEARFGSAEAMKTPFALMGKPLVIVGLGSFKMRTRPSRAFHMVPGVLQPHEPFTKPPARRLAFTAKWEPLP
jgi:hypothetical protein